MRPLELYLHIPFCVSKCKYCDFLSAPSTKEERQEYIESLCREIHSYGELAEAYHVVSVFVGGGTPSILEPAQILSIFKNVREVFTVDDTAEITIEMNPGTVTQDRLAAYEKAGINRLSIGLQSADDRELGALGRIHTYEEFLDTYQMARDAGFQNINIDLMSAIPFQTAAKWERTLRKAAELSPEHISAYSLILEEGTPLYDRYAKGEHKEELPCEEEERMMYEKTASVLLEYGYKRYEISNYAKPGYECRHNLGYWDRTEYLGIGTGAASLIGAKRFTKGEEPEYLSRREEMEEYMFLGLRKMEGVSQYIFLQTFGCSMESVYGKVIEKLCEQKLIESEGDMVRLTDRGIDISNYVMSQFLIE